MGLCSTQAFRRNGRVGLSNTQQTQNPKVTYTKNLQKKHICTWHAPYKRQGQGWLSMLSFMNEDTAQEGHTVEVYGDRSTRMQQIRFHLHPAGKAVLPRDLPKMHLFRDPSTYHRVLWVYMFYSEVRKENCWNSWSCNMLLEQNGT